MFDDSQCIPEYDLVVRSGTVVDGGGGPAFEADVGIRGDRFAHVGDLQHARGKIEIDARGLVVAPGFIDVHTHDDAAAIESPEMVAKLTQGVTTVICGNCGISAAPCKGGHPPPGLLRLVFKSDAAVSLTFENYLQKVASAGPAVNVAAFTGHTTLRMTAMSHALERPATANEASLMRHMLRESLEHGSLGLSTGLFYAPARAASVEEIAQVAGALTDFQGIYATHLRDESDHVVESIHEALRIGRTVAAPVVISHHKCMGRRNFGRSIETLALLEGARKQQRVAWDIYPYTAASTVLNQELVDKSERVVLTWSDPYPELSGVDLSTAAQILASSIPEAIAKLQPAGALYFLMDDSDVTRILCSSNAMIGSDGLPGDRHPHPRLWGTFPRIFSEYVRKRGLLSLENAVHRMTGLVAENFGFANRGRLVPSNYADLCIFDSDSISDTATYQAPRSASRGIQHVVVNGEIALRDGELTAIRAGRALRRQDLQQVPAGVR